VWAVLEIDLGIICASIPSLKALVIKMFPNFFRSSLPNRARPTTTGYSKKFSDGSAATPNALESGKWNGSGQVLPKNNTKTRIRGGDSQERIIESGVGKHTSINRTVEIRHDSSIELNDRKSDKS
jgi:hypothetical protein